MTSYSDWDSALLFTHLVQKSPGDEEPEQGH